MLTSIQGQFNLPGISDTYTHLVKDITWGPAELQILVPGQISGASRDAGNTPTTLLRPGLLLGIITSSGKYIQWDPTATDGSQYIAGILITDMAAQQLATNTDRFLGVLVSGCVKAASLLIGGESTYGLSGKASEHIVKQQLSINFKLDTPLFANNGGRWRKVRVVTADTTLTAADNGCLFVTNGSGAINFTLPAMLEGLEFGFYNAVDQNMTITSAPADTLVAFNDIAADSVALSTSSEKVGGMFEVLGLSTGKGLVIPHLWEAQTMTIAT